MSLQGLGAQAQAAAGGVETELPGPYPEDPPDVCKAHQSVNADDLEPPARYVTRMPPCRLLCCIDSAPAAQWLMHSEPRS